MLKFCSIIFQMAPNFFSFLVFMLQVVTSKAKLNKPQIRSIKMEQEFGLNLILENGYTTREGIINVWTQKRKNKGLVIS